MSDCTVVTVDQDVCMGSGYCARETLNLFHLREDGIAELDVNGTRTAGPVQIPVADQPAACHAASICPSGAITVSDH